MSFAVPNAYAMTGPDGRPTATWAQWTTRINQIANSLQTSGATAERPSTGLWIGRMFFDSTLGKPVWVKSVKPAVWVDASGVVV